MKKSELPEVFVSSTVNDLQPHREAVEKAILQANCHPVMCENWEAADKAPLDECLKRMDGCDIVVAIVAERHGWTPEDQPKGEYKSITRLECEHAAGKDKKIDIIPFFLEDPPEPVATEDDRLTEAGERGQYQLLPQLAQEIPRNKASLGQFKAWLAEGRLRKTFDTADKLASDVAISLSRWRHDDSKTESDTAADDFDQDHYLGWLQRQCESVELLGLDPMQANNARLRQVYVPAMVVWPDADLAWLKQHQLYREREQGGPEAERGDRSSIALPLLHRLAYQSLYLPGAPGAGKSTFCRWLALTTAGRQVPEHPIPIDEDYRETLLPELAGRVPVLCYLRDLNDLPALRQGKGGWTKKRFEDALAAWLDQSEPGGLRGEAWRKLLASGECLMILDGVDELQTRHQASGVEHWPRANFLSGLCDALPAWQAAGAGGNRVLLTSRPYGLSAAERGKVARAMGDPSAISELQELAPALQSVFIQRWYDAVDRPHAANKSDGLWQQLTRRDDLRPLRGNPMLLTAVCVKYDEGNKLPEDIHVLYHSVINQVLFSRYQDPVAVRRRLAAVALGMHTGSAVAENRSTPAPRVSHDELECILADYANVQRASEAGGGDAATKRENLLSRSGLLLPSGDAQAQFYHLSFQEFLAAEQLHIANTDLLATLTTHAGVAEWRRTLMFLFCAVAQHNPQQALDALGDALLPDLTLEAVQNNDAPALLLLDCLEIAHGKAWSIEGFTAGLWQLCQACLQTDLPVSLRNTLWLAAGSLDIDRRHGVGLRDPGVGGTALPVIDWVAIDGGTVKLEDNAGEYLLAAFQIARYPVTNAQFQAFVNAEDGHRNRRWWDDEWISQGWVEPGQAATPSWSEANAPRESVSWFEAMAYCRWLDHHYRDELAPARQIRLPTEWEWQQAATGGDPKRIYPWGKSWHADRCNSDESRLDRTSAVGLYPNGTWPGGPLDMVGNVWEWCLNGYDQPGDTSSSGNDLRVLRGDSWIFNRDFCRAAYRSRSDPGNRSVDNGFRVCLSSPIESD